MHFRFDFKQGKEKTKVTRSFLFKWQSAVHRWRVKQIAKKLPNEIGSLKYKFAIYGALSFFPCAPWNKSQNREYLKSAGEHIKYQHELWKCAVRAEVPVGPTISRPGPGCCWSRTATADKFVTSGLLSIDISSILRTTKIKYAAR